MVKGARGEYTRRLTVRPGLSFCLKHKFSPHLNQLDIFLEQLIDQCGELDAPGVGQFGERVLYAGFQMQATESGL